MPNLSDDYNLTIRQQPERAKLAGQKEKDRKPIDPPPIVQLQIRDLSDPAQNYLQSPYYFMCCNLCDANDQISTLTSQATLAGTLVSSLHRLKDIDNTDGGFFVFGDVSVKVEGEFRLRFSLFEMIREKAEVVYIRSIVSNPFKGLRQEDYPRNYAPPPILENRPVPSQPPPLAHKQPMEYAAASSRCFSPPHNDSSSKRQRTSADMTSRGFYDQDQRYGERPFEEHRGAYATSDRSYEDHRNTYAPNRNQLPHPVLPPQTGIPNLRTMPLSDQTLYPQDQRYSERPYDRNPGPYGIQTQPSQSSSPFRHLPSLNS